MPITAIKATKKFVGLIMGHVTIQKVRHLLAPTSSAVCPGTDMFGAARSSYSPTKRLGNDQSRLSQIQGGKWVVVSDYLK